MNITKNEIFGLIVSLVLIHFIIFIYLMSPGMTTVGMSTGSGITKVIVKNDAPVLTTIPDQAWQENISITINLSQYFNDPENIQMTFNSTPVNNIMVTINQTTGVATLAPDSGWTGVREIYFYASDGANIRPSNKVTLAVGVPLPVTEDEEPTSSDGGSAGGGGGCLYRWECQQWSSCLEENIQRRACTNIGTCPDSFNHPADTRPCVHEEEEVPPVIEQPGKPEDEVIKEETETGQKQETGAEQTETQPVTGEVRHRGDIKTSNMLLLTALVIVIISLIILSIHRPFLLADVPDDKVFIAKDEQEARNLKQMKDIILKMDKETFEFHAAEEKDDFADWIGQVLKERKLAKQLREAGKTRKRYAVLIARRIGEIRKSVK